MIRLYLIRINLRLRVDKVLVNFIFILNMKLFQSFWLQTFCVRLETGEVFSKLIYIVKFRFLIFLQHRWPSSMEILPHSPKWFGSETKKLWTPETFSSGRTVSV